MKNNLKKYIKYILSVILVFFVGVNGMEVYALEESRDVYLSDLDWLNATMEMIQKAKLYKKIILSLLVIIINQQKFL